MRLPRAAALAVVALSAACSGRGKTHYKHCLNLRVGMTKAQVLEIMGEPETTLPYVEGKSLDYLKGRTAYEWSNTATMPGPDHVSVEDRTGKVESIRCAGVGITASVFVEPPLPAASTAPVAAPRVTPGLPAEPTLDDALAAYRKKDLQAALKLAIPLANAGSADAQLLVGMVYFTAKDVGLQSNVDEAMRWFYAASRQKNCEAQALYASAIVGRAPAKTIVSETELAGDMGCPSGKLLQAKMLMNGYQDLIAADADAAEKLLQSAAQDGSPSAQLQYGERLKDPAEACRWLRLAAGRPPLDKFADPLHALSSAWSPEQKAEAQSRLRSCAGK